MNYIVMNYRTGNRDHYAWRAGWVAVIFMLALGLVLVGGCGKGAGSERAAGRKDKKPRSSHEEREKPKDARPTATVTESNSLKLTSKNSGNCTALAPFDWAITAGPASDSADMLSSDRKMYAGWGIKAVNTSLAGYAHLYQPPINDPELYSSDPATTVKAYGNVVIHSGRLAENDSSSFAYTGEIDETIGPYKLRSMESKEYKGVALFHSRGFAGDGQYINYIEPMHFAITTKDIWRQKGMLVAKVAASIRCTTQLQPNNGGADPDLGGSGSGAGETGSAGGDGDDASDYGYNPQLGTEYVHDKETGQNYLVSPSESWSQSGPDGPGYYAPKGSNDWTKLEPGRSD